MSDNLPPYPTRWPDGVRLCSFCGQAEADDADGLCAECWARLYVPEPDEDEDPQPEAAA